MNTPDPKNLLSALERRKAENLALKTDAEARFEDQDSEGVDEQLSDAEIASNRASLRASLILAAIVGGVLSISAIRNLVRAVTGEAVSQDAPIPTMTIGPYDPGSDGGEEVFMDSPDVPFGADGRAGTADDKFPNMVAIKSRRQKEASGLRLKSGGIADGNDSEIIFPEPPKSSLLPQIRMDLIPERGGDSGMNIKSMR